MTASSEIVARIVELERELLQLRRETQAEQEPLPDQPLAVLELQVGEGIYLLSTETVVEVLPMVWCNPLPEAPQWVLGLIRYADQVPCVIDLRARLDGVRRPPALSDRIVLLEAPHLVGFAVADTRSVVTVPPDAWRLPNPGLRQAPFLTAMLPSDGRGAIHLLSPQRLAREYVIGDD